MGNGSDWVWTEEGFGKVARQFQSEGWNYREHDSYRRSSYLEKKVISRCAEHGDSSRRARWLLLTSNVSFSPSYSMPVLYFKLCDETGHEFTLKEFERYFEGSELLGATYIGVSARYV